MTPKESTEWQYAHRLIVAQADHVGTQINKNLESSLATRRPHGPSEKRVIHFRECGNRRETLTFRAPGGFLLHERHGRITRHDDSENPTVPLRSTEIVPMARVQAIKRPRGDNVSMGPPVRRRLSRAPLARPSVARCAATRSLARPSPSLGTPCPLGRATPPRETGSAGGPSREKFKGRHAARTSPRPAETPPPRLV